MFHLQRREGTDFERWFWAAVVEVNTLVLLLIVKDENQIRAKTRKYRQVEIRILFAIDL